MKRNKVTLVLGRKGQGKSYSVKRELDRLPAKRQLLIWDPNREYAGKTGVDPIKGAIAYSKWREFLAAQAAKKGALGRVALQCERQAFGAFCAYALACGHLTVVIDELHMFVESQSYPDSFAELLYIGRHRGIDVVACAWRPFGLPPFMRHAVDEVRAFACNEPLDLKWFTQVCGAEFVKKLTQLPERKSLLWTPTLSAPSPKSSSKAKP